MAHGRLVCALANPDDPVNGDLETAERRRVCIFARQNYIFARQCIFARLAVQSEFLTENGHINSIRFYSVGAVH